VSVAVPTAALAAAVIVIDPVDVPAPIVNADAVTCVGKPSTVTVTEPEKPPVLLIVMLRVPVPAAAIASEASLVGTMELCVLPPAWTESVVGATASVKASVSVGPPSSSPPPQAVRIVEQARAMATALRDDIGLDLKLR
jgi:hypothetical protein